MPRGDKSAYTNKQKRQAEHIEEGYKKQGVSTDEAEARAWATVNKATGGGKKSGSGRGKRVNKSPMRKGGRKAAAKRRARKSTTKRSARKSTAKRSTRKRTAKRGARKTTTKRRSTAAKRRAGAKGGRKTARKRSR
jgi:hypothetical protein